MHPRRDDQSLDQPDDIHFPRERLLRILNPKTAADRLLFEAILRGLNATDEELEWLDDQDEDEDDGHCDCSFP